MVEPMHSATRASARALQHGEQPVVELRGQGLDLDEDLQRRIDHGQRVLERRDRLAVRETQRPHLRGAGARDVHAPTTSSWCTNSTPSAAAWMSSSIASAPRARAARNAAREFSYS